MEVNMNIYPNPSEGDIVVQFNKWKQATGQLIDAMGRVVRNVEFDGNNTQYEINEISNGIYTLSIQYVDGTTESKRIIIK